MWCVCVWLIIDTWLGSLTRHILYCVLSTLLFIYLFMSFLISVYIMIICLHLYTCASFFYSYTFTRSSDSLDLHIQIRGYLLLIRYLEMITRNLRSWSLSLPDYGYPSLLSCYSLILSISYPVIISYSCSYAIFVLDIYMSYYSDIDCRSTFYSLFRMF